MPPDRMEEPSSADGGIKGGSSQKASPRTCEKGCRLILESSVIFRCPTNPVGAGIMSCAVHNGNAGFAAFRVCELHPEPSG